MPIPGLGLLAANPEISLFALQQAARLVGGIFGGRDEEKAAEEATRKANLGNLVSVLSKGRVGFSPGPVQVKQGLGSKIAGGVETGAGIGLGAFGLKNALTDRARAQELADTQLAGAKQGLAAGERAAEQSAGADLFATDPGALSRKAQVDTAPGFGRGSIPAPTNREVVSPAFGAGFQGAQRGQEQQSILAALAQVNSDQAGRRLDQGDVKLKQGGTALEIQQSLAETRADTLTLDQNKFNNSLNKTGLLAPDQVLKQENTLRKEYDGLSTDFNKVRSSYVRILATTKNPSAAGDLALIFNFMKMLDPGSVVRESEFKNAEATGSFDQKVQNQINRFWDGERLTVTREDFISQAGNLFKGQLATQDELAGKYKGISDRQGLDVRNVVFRFSAPTAEDVEAVVKVTTPSGERIQETTIDATLERAEAGDKSAKVQLLAWGYN